MTSADPPLPAERAAPEAELKHGAISFLDALVIGLASTSPAYSLAAVIGPITIARRLPSSPPESHTMQRAESRRTLPVALGRRPRAALQVP